MRRQKSSMRELNLSKALPNESGVLSSSLCGGAVFVVIIRQREMPSPIVIMVILALSRMLMYYYPSVDFLDTARSCQQSFFFLLFEVALCSRSGDLRERQLFVRANSESQPVCELQQQPHRMEQAAAAARPVNDVLRVVLAISIQLPCSKQIQIP